MKQSANKNESQACCVTPACAIADLNALLEELNAVLAEVRDAMEPVDVTLRSDLRVARRLLRRCADFVSDNKLVTFRGQDKRLGLLEDIARETRGT